MNTQDIIRFFILWLMTLAGTSLWLMVPAFVTGTYPVWAFVAIAYLLSEMVIVVAKEYARNSDAG